MEVISNPNTIFFDVDDCIVYWNTPSNPETPLKYFDIETPWGTMETLAVNESTIKDLNQHYAQGHHICVWSQGGHAWAKAVVDSLGLTKKVNMVMTKPKWFVDDLPFTAWSHWIKK